MTCTETPQRYRRGGSSRVRDDCEEARSELSARELEVMRLLVTGVTENCISCRLGITRHTVRSHIAHSSRKLKVSGKLMLVAIVISYNIVPIEEVRELLCAHTGVPFAPHVSEGAICASRQTDDCV